MQASRERTEMLSRSEAYAAELARLYLALEQLDPPLPNDPDQEPTS